MRYAPSLVLMTLIVAPALAQTGPALAQTGKDTQPFNPEPWLPRQTADLQVLDKLNAHATAMTLRVGQQAENGSLTIALRNCAIRPPNVPQDSAAFLDIQDNRPGATGFHGWMFSGEPAVAMLENPIYDVHVVACR